MNRIAAAETGSCYFNAEQRRVNKVKDILIILAITPPVTLLIGVYVGTLQTVIDWLDERAEARKKRKEEKKDQRGA